MTHPFTPTYIAMAKAAEEIQAMRPGPDAFVSGDWISAKVDLFSTKYGGTVGISGKQKVLPAGDMVCIGSACMSDSTDFGECHPLLLHWDSIEWATNLTDRGLIDWMPRLDQLLGMLGGKHGPQCFYHALSVDLIEKWEYMDWHELAIRYVMHEKYGKTWDGKGWVKG